MTLDLFAQAEVEIGTNPKHGLASGQLERSPAATAPRPPMP